MAVATTHPVVQPGGRTVLPATMAGALVNVLPLTRRSPGVSPRAPAPAADLAGDPLAAWAGTASAVPASSAAAGSAASSHHGPPHREGCAEVLAGIIVRLTEIVPLAGPGAGAPAA